ncbi:sigma factor [Paraconexibacter sp. AEG42_29]|uniref:Sigma factor n=1 Tax=Paraconexibacter sp. AEG42_29 TaxID=2997339 RepID=A0AAU7ATA5_9ACTN
MRAHDATPTETARSPGALRDPDTSEWLVAGQPLQDAGLRDQITAVLGNVAELVPTLPAPQPRDVLSQDAAEAALDQALEHVSAAMGATLPAEQLRMLADHAGVLHELHRALGEVRLDHRSRAFTRVQEALGRLREMGTVDQAIKAVAGEVVSLGFPRVIVSRVTDGTWMPEAVIVDGDQDWADAILAAGRAQPQPLDHMILEAEMVRRRAPMIVHDVQNDPRAHRPIADTSHSRSYVTAPLMPEGRVIGFIHADCYSIRRDVDEFDRDVLWMFAEGAGYAIERTVLQERLRDLRDRVRGLTDSISAAMDEVVNAEVEMARLDRATTAVTQAAASAVVVPGPRLRTLLTRREIEIAQLMATGNTNAEIARRLVISEGTVKTHVSNVLRKLRASNRTQAVAAVSRLMQLEAPDR